MRKYNLNIAAAVCALMMTLTVADPAGVVTHYVSPGQSIQAAIDAASNGDEIEVAPGTYNEAINFIGKAVRLYSSGGPEVTTIEGAGLNSTVVTCNSGEGPGTILEGFEITGGDSYKGGGMYNGYGSNPNVTDCIFQHNTARVWGAGMFNKQSTPTVTNCEFLNNYASWNGGGMFNEISSPTVIDCNFINNNAAQSGGGMYSKDDSNSIVTNCTFYKNTTGNGQYGVYPGGAGDNGGDGAGMYNYNSNPTVSYCTFEENSTGSGGKGGPGLNGFFDIGNGGAGGNGGKGAGMYNYSSNPNVSNCYFRLNKTGKGGTGGDGGMNTVFDVIQGNGGQGGDAGCGAAIYNEQSLPTVTDCRFTSNQTGDGGVGGTGWGESYDTYGAGGKAGDGAGIYNKSSGPVIYGSEFNQNKTGNGGFGKSGTGDSGNGGGIYNHLSTFEVLNCKFNLNETGTGGGGGGRGAGIYNFDSDPNVTNCIFSRNKTGNGLGGEYFAGVIEGGPGGNGAGMYNNSSSPNVSNCTFSENLTGSGNGAQGDTVLDGGYGAGMYNGNNSSPIVSYCSFTKNKTGNGGNGRFQTILKIENRNGGNGGKGAGIYNCENSSPVLKRCDFTENLTGNGGNGDDGYVSSIWDFFTAIFFSPQNGGDGGLGGDGAGIYNGTGCSVTVSDCAFVKNVTGSGGLGGKPGQCGPWKGRFGLNGRGGMGGGIGSYQSSPVLTNSTFISNTAVYGGGMSNEHYSNSILTNCTFTKNVGKISGGGMYSSTSSPTVTNCIFWEGVPNEIAGSPTNVTYCDVEGGYAGTGNINSVPAFADDAGRLSLGSICIDAGSNSAPNLPDKDFDGWPRIMGAAVDMGAFEYTADLRIRNITKDILYASIQSAINDANDGDEITVLPGIYSSAINFSGKAIRLFSANKNLTGFTVINGNGAYHAVQCISGEGADTILEGFIITGGDANGASAPDNCGGGMYIKSSSPTIINCIFASNAGYDGAGMSNTSSSPTVTNCNFSYNDATHTGGGMYNINNSNPIMTNCSFTNNTTASYGYGGGICNVLSSSPALTNCNFTENEAGGGGGMINSVNCSPSIVNCVFTANSANYGGGIYNIENSNQIVTNCTFTDNTAITNGGAIRNYQNSSPTVTNCILWDDTPDEISNYASSPVVTYCDVKMPSGTYPGFGNINADPGFFAGRIHNRPQYALYLASWASPCVDAGDSNVPGLPSEDADGQPRICDGDIDDNPVVDMGAYEFRPRVTNTTRDSWYQLIQAAVMDANEADHIVVSPGTYYDDYVDFSDGPDLVLTSADPNDPDVVAQTIIIGRVSFCSQSRLCVFAGFTITSDLELGSGGGIGSYCGLAPSPTIRNCVITNADGIRLSSGSALISGCTIRGNRHAGLALGGTAGSNITVEDCIITDHYDLEEGCAVLIRDGNTILTRCIISANLADPRYCTVNGISCLGDAVLKDCVITNNSGRGIAGMSAGKISGCTISNNKEGGISGWAGPIENCTITGNGPPDFGGGIEGCTGPITGCLIERNEAWYGGGLAACSGPITNCIIAANRAREQYGGDGGGLAWCNGTISNCTIVGNVAWNDEFENPGLGGGLYECTGTITNCIIRQNVAQADGDQLYSSSVPSYSCIQDWPGGGVGNISDDPCFVYAGYWADFNDPNTVVEPNDPNAVWVDGYYRLRRGSACIDAGDNNSVPADTYDLDADGDVNEPIPFDLDSLPRFIEDLCTVDSGNPGTLGPPVVDMGAYEFLPADIDSSSTVDLHDLSMLALYWAETDCGRCGGANLNCDGKVDLNDLRLLTDWWLIGTEPEL